MRGPSGSWRSVAAWAVLILVATTVPVADLVTRAPALWLDKFVHGGLYLVLGLSLIHISEPTRLKTRSRMASSA